MKIAFAFTNFPTGGELSNLSRVTGLIDLGHEIDIYALGPDQNLKRNHEIVDEYHLHKKTYYYGGKSNFQFLKGLSRNLARNPTATIRICSMASDAAMSYNRLYASIRGYSSNRTEFASEERQSFANAYRLLRHFRCNGVPDILNVLNGTTARKLLFLKDNFPQLKFVATFVGFDFSSRVRYHGTRYYDELFQKADLIMTKSRFSRDCLIELGCPEEKTLVHYNGIDLKSFPYFPRQVPKKNQDYNFISVARLVEKKNHRVLLQAFGRLARKYGNVRLRIVGDGHLRQQIEQQINADEVLRRCVQLLGWQPHQHVAALLRQSHVFVLPSVTTMRWAEMEDTPTALLEAQAMGLPVISTHHAGIAEIVNDGETGLLVPERSEIALLDALCYMVEHPDEWSVMGYAGRSMVDRRFNLEKLSRSLDFIFKEICKLPHGRSLNLGLSEQFSLEREQDSMAARFLSSSPASKVSIQD